MLKVKKIAGALGAEVSGVDLSRPLPAEVQDANRHAFMEHGGVFFRDQPLTPAQFLDFAQVMGEPVEYPFFRGIADSPEIEVKKLEHERVDFGGVWHSDTTYLETPPMGTILLAREIPPAGGDTLFANQHLAYEALSPGMQTLIDALDRDQVFRIWHEPDVVPIAGARADESALKRTSWTQRSPSIMRHAKLASSKCQPSPSNPSVRGTCRSTQRRRRASSRCPRCGEDHGWHTERAGAQTGPVSRDGRIGDELFSRPEAPGGTGPSGEVRPVSERLIVIGADAAGMSAASQARRRRSAEELAITAFDRGNYASYSACGIPYFVGGVVDDLESLIVRRPETFRDNYAIDVQLGHEVEEIDLESSTVRVREFETGRARSESFDELLVATGAEPVRPPLPGADSEGIYGIQTLDDGLAIQRAMDDRRPQRAVIVGGGYIGLEMAEALCGLGLDTHLVDAASQPMSTLDVDMGALVADALREFGVTLHLGQRVLGFETTAGRVTAVRTDDAALPADLVVLGLGVRPKVGLAERAGIPLGPSGGVAVDRRMRTRVSSVWAAGDCAEKFHRVSGQPVTIALGTHANKEGRVAGINIGGDYATFPGVIGTAATKVCSLEVARTGLNESEASAAGFVIDTVTAESTTRAGYYPDAAPISTKLVFEQKSGRLLGAQLVGREGAAKRVDALALAVWNEMAVDELLNVDLSYAPPYSPVWDPILTAARMAHRALG